MPQTLLIPQVFWMRALAGLLLLVLLLGGGRAWALMLEPGQARVELSGQVLLLEDPAHELSAEEVFARHAAGQLPPPDARASALNLGYSRSAWWIILPLDARNLQQNEVRFLELGFAPLDDIRFYAGAGHEAVITGDLLSFDSRPLAHRAFVFPLQIAAGEQRVLLLRVASKGSLTLPLTLWQAEDFHAHSRSDYAWLAFALGALLALMLYNALLWTSVRERVYLEYVAFAATMVLGLLGLHGLAAQFVWPGLPLLGHFAYPVGFALCGVASFQFTRSFLDTRRHAPRIDQALAGLALFALLVAVILVGFSYRLGAILLTVALVVLPLVALATGLWFLFRGLPNSRLYVGAWALFMLFGAAFSARNAGWVPTNFLTLNGLLVGSLLAMLMLSFALAERINALRRERSEAEMLAGAKSQFLANMSHEIRAPLNAIVGMLHLALRTELTPRQRGYLKKIDGASKSLLGVINNILDVSKIEAGKLEVELTALELQSVLDSVADVTGLQAEEKGLGLVLELAPGMPRHFLGDPLRLAQILINLVGNAVKFTERGEIVVRVLAQGLTADGRVRLRFEVRDSGIGMSAAQLARVFDSFAQADRSTTRRYGGTGLGLSICKQLVELMGGAIGAESEPGRGSCFYFTLALAVAAEPLSAGAAQASATQDPEAQASFPSESAPDLALSGKRVLLVEDNAVNRELMVELLEGFGLQIACAENGREAVERASAEVFDLILMDIQMPEMDGLTATRILRRDPRLRQVPILAMTAHALSSDREKSLAAGMNDHLTKPIDPQGLLATLARWLPVAHSERLPTPTRNVDLAQEGGQEGAPQEEAVERDAGLMRILVVDDEIANIELLAEIFGDEQEVLFATEGLRALELAAVVQPDVILLDVVMPGIDGFEVCARLQADPATAEIPVIFITGLEDSAAEIRGLALGAMDYVTKPFSPPVVQVRVRNQLELKRARDQLTRQASTDGLTGIPNRRCFDEVFALEAARHQRTGGVLSLILLDIDHFKPYNDHYGHVQGDTCLRSVALTIERSLTRATDFVARYGGEEFACVLPDTDAAGALAIAERIRGAISALDISHADSPVAPNVTASLGVLSTRCSVGETPAQLIRRADALLYRAKLAGRNRCECG